MNETNSSSEVLKLASEYLEEEGEITKDAIKSPSEVIKTLIIPGLNNSKNVLSDIYFKPSERVGFVGKVKSLVQNKIIFTVVNVIEKQSMRQQKFNGLTTKAIENLLVENESLKTRLEKIEKSN